MKRDEIRISRCETHHLINGKPLYPERFRKVLSFHPPGVAAVVDDSGSYHINTDGKPLSDKRFLETFGYYDDCAGVCDETGMYHIDLNGNPLYKERYQWVGNFQEFCCPVRDCHGLYFHIDCEGNPIYSKKFAYAGDFKYGIAVVYEEGKGATHISNKGDLVHYRWFYECDNYHKGCAAVRDECGWTHIDLKGRPLYSERYAKVEPFYNGRAFCREFSGRQVIRTIKGEIIPVMHLEDQPYRIKRPDYIIPVLKENDWDSGIIFIRHAEREPIFRGESDVGSQMLTESGCLASFNFGKDLASLQKRIDVSLFSSPIIRCLDTAKEVSNGAEWNLEPVQSCILGDPGAYIHDTELTDEIYANSPARNLVLRYLNGEILPGHRTSKEGTNLILEYFDSMLEKDSSLSLCVSHDAVLVMFLSELTGFSFENTWVDFLEGIVILRKGTDYYLYWRGVPYCLESLSC
ncbi:histidine phosphatase family protein [Methanolacinia paynteri]|uniref:histidine phosphatase family protein n=1 Tax=Methanolacinia paynteri TaxID=230356 RepID=UPI0006942E14|nr:histidine phosphatase family protein [Methanolacinia paynteri]